MKYLGTKNNHKYYVDFDEPDYNGLFSPLDNDNPWQLISFGRGISFDEHMNSLDEFQDYLADQGVYVHGSLSDFKFDCEQSGIPENEFFIKLNAMTSKAGAFVRPITKTEHDSVYFGVGVGQGFDSGVCGLAVITKAQIRQTWERKRITKKLMKTVNADLDIEIRHINEDNNSELYNLVVKDRDGNEIEALGGIYMSDFDNAKNKLQFAADMI